MSWQLGSPFCPASSHTPPQRAKWALSLRWKALKIHLLLSPSTHWWGKGGQKWPTQSDTCNLEKPWLKKAINSNKSPYHLYTLTFPNVHVTCINWRLGKSSSSLCHIPIRNVAESLPTDQWYPLEEFHLWYFHLRFSWYLPPISLLPSLSKSQKLLQHKSSTVLLSESRTRTNHVRSKRWGSSAVGFVSGLLKNKRQKNK